MKPASPSPASRILKNFLDALVIIPVTVIIIVAVGLAAASMFENIRFAKATDQILSLVSAARDFSGNDERFAGQPGEDLLATLAHVGLIANIVDAGPTAQLINPWHSNITATASAAYDMRVETDIPVRACRRLAFFFGGHIKDLGLHIMEAREGAGGAWRRFYDSSSQGQVDEAMIEAACGETPPTSLALVFKLR